MNFAASRPTALRRRLQINPNVGYPPPPPFVRAVHVFCHLLPRRRAQTHPRFRLLVYPRAAGRPSRLPGAGLGNSETALQDAHHRRRAALQVRRPLLHSTVGTVPVGLVPAIVGDGNVKPSPKHYRAANAAVPAAHSAIRSTLITVTAACIADKTAHDPASATNMHDNGRPRRSGHRHQRRRTIAHRSYGFRSWHVHTRLARYIKLTTT